MGASVDPAQAVRIASIAKTFVAAATLRLVDESRLGLDDPVGPLLPGPLADALRADGYDLTRITVRMLLSHTAGLFDYAEHPAFQARVVNEPGHVWTRDEQVAFAMDHGDPLAAPGERFAYSDTGYVLLSALIETVTAQPMATAVRELLSLDRLGLSHTWFETLEPAMKTPSSQSMASTDTGYGMGLSTRNVNGCTCHGHGDFWGVMAWHCPAIALTMAGFVTHTNHRQALSAQMDDVARLFICAG